MYRTANDSGRRTSQPLVQPVGHTASVNRISTSSTRKVASPSSIKKCEDATSTICRLNPDWCYQPHVSQSRLFRRGSRSTGNKLKPCSVLRRIGHCSLRLPLGSIVSFWESCTGYPSKRSMSVVRLHSRRYCSHRYNSRTPKTSPVFRLTWKAHNLYVPENTTMVQRSLSNRSQESERTLRCDSLAGCLHARWLSRC
jgi:hypothetical protein